MSFEWNKMYKVEERIDAEIGDAVHNFVCEYYDVDEITDLTKNQIDEIDEFRDGLDEYSFMHIGFLSLIDHWDANQ